MGDLICRQAAIDAFLTELTKRERKNLLHTWSTVEVKYFITKMLEQMPSAQPEIIRCEDCQYHIPQDERCRLWCQFVDQSEWCSRAKRKDGEADG